MKRKRPERQPAPQEPIGTKTVLMYGQEVTVKIYGPRQADGASQHARLRTHIERPGDTSPTAIKRARMRRWRSSQADHT